MSTINFNTTNQTWRQLLGNGLIYRVPRFQRDYSWGQDEWEDLWLDIANMFSPDGEPAHYMGYLVFQSKDQRVFEIIDGQQRLTTLSLLVLAVLKHLKELIEQGVEPENNKRREEQLRNTFIGYLDPVTLVAQPKLSLNRNNDGFYRDKLVPLEKLPQRGLSVSERLLKKGFEWFYKKLKDTYAKKKNGQELARFLTDLSDKLFFTVITVTDELNAFKVFETLNARGVRLSPTDLLKNYLFSVVYREGAHDTEIDALERRWSAMVDKPGSEDFPSFLRAYWNSRSNFVREAELFKTIRRSTPDKKSVFELIRKMEEDIDVYVALGNPEDSLWNVKQKKYIRELKMFRVRQPWPLLLVCYRVLDEKDLEQILRCISIVSFRYNVISTLATNIQERTYNKVAQNISQGELQGTTEIIMALKDIYVPDQRFEPAFAEKILKTTSSRNKKIARYILFAIEKHLTGKDYDIESSKYTLEHILPENPEKGWDEFRDSQLDEAIYRLGNFTILEAELNREGGNKDFKEKREIYQKSGFKITRLIAEENEEWNMSRLVQRQLWMAKQAKGIWSIAQLK
jgi:uncharacterized protein with ParB-like and HNH nuclease domain